MLKIRVLITTLLSGLLVISCGGQIEQPGDDPNNTTEPHRAECAGGRYTVLDSGTTEVGTGLVRDNRTGLTWTRRIYHEMMNSFHYADAQKYCVSHGMRLPTLVEAQGIAGQSFAECAWPLPPWGTFTSTYVDATNVWLVDLHGGSQWPVSSERWDDGVFCVR